MLKRKYFCVIELGLGQADANNACKMACTTETYAIGRTDACTCKLPPLKNYALQRVLSLCMHSPCLVTFVGRSPVRVSDGIPCCGFVRREEVVVFFNFNMGLGQYITRNVKVLK